MTRFVYRTVMLAGLLGALSFSAGPAVAQTETSSSAPVTGSASNTRDDRGNYGWVGLIGLAGLAGLMGRTSEADRRQSTQGMAAQPR